MWWLIKCMFSFGPDMGEDFQVSEALPYSSCSAKLSGSPEDPPALADGDYGGLDAR